MNQALSYYLLVLDILSVTYFLTSVTMSDPATSYYASDAVNDVIASYGISSPSQAFYV